MVVQCPKDLVKGRPIGNDAKSQSLGLLQRELRSVAACGCDELHGASVILVRRCDGLQEFSHLCRE